MRKPEYTKDNVVYRDYQSKQISMTQTNKYVFKTELIKDCVFREIVDYMIFGNEIYVSDYNKKNHSIYKNVAVELEESEEPEYLNEGALIMSLVFTDRVKNRFKSNYGLTQIAGSKFLEGQIGSPPVPPPPCEEQIVIKGFFTIAGEPDMPPITIDNDTAGTFPTLLFDSGSGSVEISIDDVPATSPYVLSVGNVLDASRTDDSAVGWYKLET